MESSLDQEVLRFQVLLDRKGIKEWNTTSHGSTNTEYNTGFNTSCGAGCNTGYGTGYNTGCDAGCNTGCDAGCNTGYGTGYYNGTNERNPHTSTRSTINLYVLDRYAWPQTVGWKPCGHAIGHE